MSKKKILLVSTTRADYGLIKRLLFLFKKDLSFMTKFLVCGTHFNSKFGNSYKEILDDNNKIDYKIEVNLKNDKPEDLNTFLNNHSKKLNLILKDEFKPDLLILLGDRFEVLSIALTSNIYSIPICHLHAGETTKGSADEKIRHAISKLSSIYFVSHKKNQNNLIKMGINKKRIFNFGALGINEINKYNLNKNLLEKKFNISLKKKTFIVTYHPETLDKSTKSNFKSLLFALEKFKDLNFIFTSPNMDEGHSIIFLEIKKFLKKNNNARFIKSMGKQLFFSSLKHIDGIIGNSSSGIIELPSFNIPTINIGNRQKERIQSKTIFNCNPKTEEIYSILKKIVKKDIKFKGYNNVYFKKKTEEKIINTLSKIDLKKIKNEN